MSKRKSSHRVFSREFKVGIVRRMLAGENVSALGSVDIHAMARKAAERWMKAQKLVSVLS